LYLSLRRLSRVEDELSEISLINQVLEVSSEDSALDGRVTHPVVEGVVLLRSWSLRVLRERSCGMPDLGLVFNGIKHVVDEDPNRIRSDSTAPSLLSLRMCWDGLWTAKLWFRVLLGGNYCFGLLPSDPCLRGDWWHLALLSRSA